MGVFEVIAEFAFFRERITELRFEGMYKIVFNFETEERANMSHTVLSGIEKRYSASIQSTTNQIEIKVCVMTFNRGILLQK